MQRNELIDGKIGAAVQDLTPQFREQLVKMSTVNKLALVDYLHAMKSEVNPADSYRKNIIKVMSMLSRFHNNKLSFKTMKRDHVVAFLDRLRKTDNEDPKQ